ncbi:MFS transporter [Pantoea stewartii]|uniref:MFS transporter n=2 Tax=Pantoea stewartii TaxID=66269 RepID=H3RH08_PANSE|nr:MFS transporter [Pantoea stewartii]ARF48747.1 MFS transporter [Pantoea stewartii subsp. stewartii DC283]EHT99348.1 putative sugar transport protein [Pantoea stewartii subsp. stewartii DC283]KAB0558695.1 MFS transporter [Pantoea stewartii subsp. stewartii]KTS71108.1 arabinose transporter permease [Pantoea stewartii]KTS95772.1 arabinose transporter permease [Pantoea stewartii]
MPVALLALALSAFAIGTTEFVIMGLLPEVANDLQVTIPSAGWLISGYALGVAIGAPVMALLTAKLPRKKTLILLMAIFIIGNLLCALAYSYNLLMLARVITALCHGAFFGIGAVVAASLVAADRQASAVALMFTGLTLANVLGVPLGTWFGQLFGWRATFWGVAVIGVLAFIALITSLPGNKNEKPVNLASEISALANGKLWLSLLMTVCFAAAMFTLFSYIAPLLLQVTGISDHGVSWTLFLIGAGLTAGNILGGKLADRNVALSLTGSFLLIALFSLLFSWTSHALWLAEITLFLWAMATFATVPGLQINVVRHGKEAPNLVSTLNISAFNVGNALGAWVGGAVIARGYGLTSVPVAAAALAAVGLIVCVITFRKSGGAAASVHA